VAGQLQVYLCRARGRLRQLLCQGRGFGQGEADQPDGRRHPRADCG